MWLAPHSDLQASFICQSTNKIPPQAGAQTRARVVLHAVCFVPLLSFLLVDTAHAARPVLHLHESEVVCVKFGAVWALDVDDSVFLRSPPSLGKKKFFFLPLYLKSQLLTMHFPGTSSNHFPSGSGTP